MHRFSVLLRHTLTLLRPQRTSNGSDLLSPGQRHNRGRTWGAELPHTAHGPSRTPTFSQRGDSFGGRAENSLTGGAVAWNRSRPPLLFSYLLQSRYWLQILLYRHVVACVRGIAPSTSSAPAHVIAQLAEVGQMCGPHSPCRLVSEPTGAREAARLRPSRLAQSSTCGVGRLVRQGVTLSLPEALLLRGGGGGLRHGNAGPCVSGPKS